MSGQKLAEVALQILRGLVRGVLTGTDDTNEYYQRVQVRGLGGEVHPDVQHIQPYGLYSNPEDGARPLLFEVGGARDHVIAILISDERYRPKNRPKGETGLHGKGYTAVRCKPGGTVEIIGGEGSAHVTVDASGNVVVEGGSVEILGSGSARVLVDASGDVTVEGGNVTLEGTTVDLKGIVTLGPLTKIDSRVFLNHTHPVTSAPGVTGGVV